MGSKKQAPPKAEEPDYQPTERELAALRQLAEVEPTPRVKVTKGRSGAPVLAPDHRDQLTGYALLAKAIGTSDYEFLVGFLGHLGNAGWRDGGPDKNIINFALSFINGINPRDPVETLLAAQMAAVHSAIMTASGRLAAAKEVRQYESAERVFNKLCRTFALQVEALKRHRSKGEQKIVVQHVTVSDGSQAIIGNVSREAGFEASSPLLVTESKAAPMPLLEAADLPVLEPRPAGRRKNEG